MLQNISYKLCNEHLDTHPLQDQRVKLSLPKYVCHAVSGTVTKKQIITEENMELICLFFVFFLNVGKTSYI